MGVITYFQVGICRSFPKKFFRYFLKGEILYDCKNEDIGMTVFSTKFKEALLRKIFKDDNIRINIYSGKIPDVDEKIKRKPLWSALVKLELDGNKAFLAKPLKGKFIRKGNATFFRAETKKGAFQDRWREGFIGSSFILREFTVRFDESKIC